MLSQPELVIAESELVQFVLSFFQLLTLYPPNSWFWSHGSLTKNIDIIIFLAHFCWSRLFPSPYNIFQPLLWGCINNISLRIFIFHVDISYLYFHHKVSIFPLLIFHLIVKFILQFICPLRPICEVINMQNTTIFYIPESKCSRTLSTPLFFAMRSHFAFAGIVPS